MNLVSSGEKQYLICSGATEMSSLRVPLMHLSRFRAVDGRFRSSRNLYRSSSFSLSLSCLKKLETVRVTGGNESSCEPEPELAPPPSGSSTHPTPPPPAAQEERLLWEKKCVTVQYSRIIG